MFWLAHVQTYRLVAAKHVENMILTRSDTVTPMVSDVSRLKPELYNIQSVSYTHLDVYKRQQYVN